MNEEKIQEARKKMAFATEYRLKREVIQSALFYDGPTASKLKKRIILVFFNLTYRVVAILFKPEKLLTSEGEKRW